MAVSLGLLWVTCGIGLWVFGWKLARLRRGSWRKLLPYNRVVVEVAERISRELRFGHWIDIFGLPRLGKTAGVVGA